MKESWNISIGNKGIISGQITAKDLLYQIDLGNCMVCHLDELEDLVNNALSITTNQLYIWLIKLYTDQTISEQIIKTYKNMISKLEKSWVDEIDTPEFIAEKEWGVISREMFKIDTFLLHSYYYFDIVIKIKMYFYDKIFILSTKEEYKNGVQSILDDLVNAFTMESGRKGLRKSTFYTDSPNYCRWKNERKHTREFVNLRLNDLKKLINKYY